jgi:hypothetical protein
MAADVVAASTHLVEDGEATKAPVQIQVEIFERSAWSGR